MSEVDGQAPPAPVEETAVVETPPAPVEAAPAPVEAPAPAPVEATPETALQDKLNQAAAENEALQARIRDLAVFQSQAAALTDGNTKLQEQVESLTAERDAAVRDAATARGDAANATATAASDSTVVGHAHSLAAAIKGLLG